MTATYAVLVEDQLVYVEIAHYTPYTPAQLSGPPENCYPEEGGDLEWDFAEGNSEFVQQAIEYNGAWTQYITDDLLAQLQLAKDCY